MSWLWQSLYHLAAMLWETLWALVLDSVYPRSCRYFSEKNKSRNNSREPDCVKWLFDRCRSRVGTRQTDCAKKCRQTVTAYVEDLRHFITQQRKI
jgi:hypothetical protein